MCFTSCPLWAIRIDKLLIPLSAHSRGSLDCYHSHIQLTGVDTHTNYYWDVSKYGRVPSSVSHPALLPHQRGNEDIRRRYSPYSLANESTWLSKAAVSMNPIRQATSSGHPIF